MGQICCSTNDGSSLDHQFTRKDFLGIKTHNIKTDYEFQKNLGQGAYGQVKLGVHKRSRVQVAIKSIQVDQNDPALMDMINNEITSLIKCDHPNIIRIFDAYKEKKVIYIVEEYIADCQEMTKLFENEEAFNEFNRIFVIDQILRALNYMHSNELVHRDLKTENVVFSPSKVGDDFSNLQMKLIDFGFAKASKKDQAALTDFVGTPYYIAPEILKDQEYGSGCDIWSLGVLTYFIIDGNFPFTGSSRRELFNKIEKGNFYFNSKIWESVSHNCKDFIKKCLTLDQKFRPSAEQLLQHEWIKSKPKLFESTVLMKKTFSDKLQNNLKSLVRTNAIQWSIISYMNQLNLYQNEFSQLRKQFEALDEDGNGTLTFQEVVSIVTEHMRTDEADELIKILHTIDSDKSGRIDYSEFMNLTMERKKLLTKENLSTTFKSLDLDESGTITMTELRQAFEAGGNRQTEKYWKDFMNQIDENKDDVIQLDEFVKWMETLLMTTSEAVNEDHKK